LQPTLLVIIFKRIILKPCDSATQTGGYITWNTVKMGGENSSLGKFFAGVCINPLTWKPDTGFVDSRYDIGSVNYSFKKIEPQELGTAIRGGVLTVSAPVNKGYKTFRTGYHIYDYNYFYMNIRKNVQLRVEAYLKTH